MTKEFVYLMQVVGLEAQGRIAPPPTCNLDWQRLFDLSESQTVEYILARAVKNRTDLNCPKELQMNCRGSLYYSVMNNIDRREKVLRMLDEMVARGIPFILLKGYAIAEYYAVPDCRISADVDILVNMHDEEKTCEFFREKAFTIHPRWADGHHCECYHSDMGHFDIHCVLFDKLKDRIWFKNDSEKSYITEPYVEMVTSNHSYKTLGYTDNMIFLILHMVKHFISSGMSLRMMLDVALFYASNKDHVNTEIVWKKLAELNYSVWFNCVLWSMVKYCGFRKDDFPGITEKCPLQVEKILDDLEMGGSMGSEDQKNRRDGRTVYNQYRMEEEKAKCNDCFFPLRWQLRQSLRTAFPSRTAMTVRYPFLKGRPYLLPLAWVYRLLVNGTKRLFSTHGKKGKREMSLAGKERVSLFKQLGMM